MLALLKGPLPLQGNLDRERPLGRHLLHLVLDDGPQRQESLRESWAKGAETAMLLRKPSPVSAKLRDRPVAQRFNHKELGPSPAIIRENAILSAVIFGGALLVRLCVESLIEKPRAKIARM